MKWTYDWLCEYLSTSLSPQEIEATLNRIGLEVEDFISPLPPIAAKIVECVPHENSDHLHVLKVDDGSGTLRQVVCGAPNARVGLISVLARPGCRIGDTVIQSGKLRGVMSDGMMCSERELGLGDDHNGIMELNAKTNVGSEVKTPNNAVIFDTSITPNRPDYLSVRGIALDLSAAGAGKYITKEIKPLKAVKGERKVNLIATDKCPTYSFCEIHGIKNVKSNEVISGRLSAAGINPKNAAIDTTNYICYDLAQPMHCFDADKLVGDITIRTAKNCEKFTDLFGNEHELCDKDLVIADDAGILALAGIVGGARAMTTDDTTNIVLESAYFEPVGIRKTSKRLGLSTDSSYRYERGIDPNAYAPALSFAAQIIMDRCGGKIVNVSVAGREHFDVTPIKYTPDTFAKKTGIELDAKKQIAILKALRFDIDDSKKNWLVTPTSARVDMVAAENVVSDLLRIYGYNNMPIDEHIYSAPAKHNDLYFSLKQHLANRGLNENISFGFGNSKIEQLITDKPLVKVANPIIVDLDTARNNLLGNLLIAVANNVKRGFSDLNMFELGVAFDGDMPGQQHTEICIVRTGVTGPKHWMGRSHNVDVFDVKADLISLLGAQKYTIETEKAPRWAHPYKYGRIVQGKKVIAEFGELHPTVAHTMHFKMPVVIGIVNNVENLPENPKFKKIPVTDFQPITRDFAFITDKDFESSKIIATATSADSRIDDATIFDAFDMGDGKKSIAFTITIYPTENMSDSELLKIQDSVIANVEKKCPAKIRDK
ncbi:MAG: phenylalanine--tRNA ligase subunit beta [Alphaproteobacteria bacterium]|nr:phenylalanine--tRNA ligase subunit beta [Alphaproteobacteria bacterium]